MMERRRAVRQRSFLRGCIQIGSGHGAADCLIRDITVYGARLVHADAAATPDAIEVYIPQKDQCFNAQVIWRYGQELGVAFGDIAMQKHEAPQDLAARVERLEHEVALLRRMLRRVEAGAA